jgi:hypothetical protein
VHRWTALSRLEGGAPLALHLRHRLRTLIINNNTESCSIRSVLLRTHPVDAYPCLRSSHATEALPPASCAAGARSRRSMRPACGVTSARRQRRQRRASRSGRSRPRAMASWSRQQLEGPRRVAPSRAQMAGLGPRRQAALIGRARAALQGRRRGRGPSPCRRHAPRPAITPATRPRAMAPTGETSSCWPACARAPLRGSQQTPAPRQTAAAAGSRGRRARGAAAARAAWGMRTSTAPMRARKTGGRSFCGSGTGGIVRGRLGGTRRPP